MRPKIIKLLEDNIVEKLYDIGFGVDFVDVTAKSQVTKAKVDNWDYIKLQNFCATKEAVNRMRRQPAKWEKIFVSQIYDEGSRQGYIKNHNSYNSTTKTT